MSKILSSGIACKARMKSVNKVQILCWINDHLKGLNRKLDD